MGKYDKVLAKIPSVFGIEPSAQMKVDVIKEEMLKEIQRHGSELAKEYGAIRAEKDAVKKQLSEVNLRLEAVTQLMQEQFENESTTRLVLSNGAAVSVYFEPSGKVLDKAGFQKWCIDNGFMEDLAMPWPRMVSILKDRLLKGLPEPDGIQLGKRRCVRFSKAGAEFDPSRTLSAAEAAHLLETADFDEDEWHGEPQ